MTITEYISHLEAIRAEHGELLMVQQGMSTVSGAVTPAVPPKVKHMRNLNKRETQERIWIAVIDNPEQKSHVQVCYVGR